MCRSLHLISIYVHAFGSALQTSIAAIVAAYYVEFCEWSPFVQQVTKKIYDVIEKCEHDFHAADVFTDPILDEQHDGIRKLQGAIKTYTDMKKGHKDASAEHMATFLFDQKILKNGL